VTWPLSRGQVVRADVGLNEPKLFVVVSNNRRNQRLGDVLAARLTTSTKPSIPSIVELEGERLSGRVVCDDILPLYEGEIVSVVGGLTPRTMRSIDLGLAAALGIDG
jgi:mRNA interferase MazF